ncbi:MAG: transposase [bacterium]
MKFLTQKKRDILYGIMDEYSRLVNIFIVMFWDKDFKISGLTKEITNLAASWLSARMRQCAAREALGMVNGARKKAIARGEDPIRPVHSGRKMTLSAQIVAIEKGRNSFDLWLVLSSVGNSIKLHIPLKRHRHFNWFREWKISNTVIIHRDYVQFSFEKETGPKKTEGKSIGVDVGINHLLATSDKELIGSEVKPLIDSIKRKKQNSRAYIRAKKTLSYYLHKIVKDSLPWKSLKLVVVEKLQDLKKGKQPKRGKAFRKTLSNWNYRELLNILQMRCEENRVFFRSVNPCKTSRTCPACSHTERGNRVGENFKCLRCGYSEQADIVGSLNILTRFTTGRYGAGFQT